MIADSGGDRLLNQAWYHAHFEEVVVAFLSAEWEKVASLNPSPPRQLIDMPRLDDAAENEARLLLLRSIREFLLERVPQDTSWFRVQFLEDRHLDEVLVIGSREWFDGRDQNELRQVAKRRKETLRSGPGEWAPPILWSHDRNGPFSILEGNHRLLGYCNAPTGTLRIECFVGLSLARCTWHRPDHPWIYGT